MVDKAVVDCVDIMRESRKNSPRRCDIEEAHRAFEDVREQNFVQECRGFQTGDPSEEGSEIHRQHLGCVVRWEK